MKIIRGVVKRLSVIIPVLLGILLPCFLYFYFWSKDDSKLVLPNAVKISNQPLPESKLFEIKNNADFSERVRNGKVLLMFLSSNCSACKKDVALISKFYPDLSSNVQIYGISVENQETMLNFINERELRFPVLNDKNGELFKKLQIKYFPTKFLVKDGVILNTWFGNFPNEKKMFEDLQVGDSE